MKTLRILLVVCLVVLLPLRGAMAAAMLCPMTTPAGSSELTVHHAAMGHAMPDAMAQMSDHAHTQHGEGQAPDTCNLCCDFCSITPPASSLPALPGAQEHSTLSFPDPGAPAPSFVSGGQERPPRST